MAEHNGGEVSLTPAQKRKQTLAKKAKVEAVVDEYGTIASSTLGAFTASPEEQMAMLKTVHRDILGLDKEGKLRPFTDLRLFMMQANRRRLDPFKKQIHAVYIWDSARQAEILTPITGIDGFRSIAQRAERPLYAGSGETTFEYKKDADGKDEKFPFKATTQVYAYNPITGAREAITTGVAIWDEYVKMVDEKVDETDKDGNPVWRSGSNGKYVKRIKTGNKVPNSTWEHMPTIMLGKCSEALALRKAFPDDLGGLYTPEEVEHLQDRTPVDESPETEAEREARVAAKVANFGKDSKATEGEVVDEGDRKTDKAADSPK
jgi:phage recombination protein Bet